ncbi:MAG: transporter substrate-binding domain-containing protein [Nitrospiraceae bacterium]
MDVSLRRSFLSGLRAVTVVALLAVTTGCGLLIDAVQWIQPIPTDEVQTICLRKRVQVGISVEPLRPFVFPAVFTDEGVRITGMDVEVIRAMVDALSRECSGATIEPVLHLVRFRDLFVLLNEGKLDFFVSTITVNLPHAARSGLAYSNPYFLDGGLGGLTRDTALAARISTHFASGQNGIDRARARQAFAGLTLAVQEGTSAELYVRDVLKDSRLLLCDSLPAAFETRTPPIDIILGKLPVLRYEAATVRKEWTLLRRDADTPLRLTREYFGITTAEENYRLRSLLNHELYVLEEAGRLADMKRRWFDEVYAYPRRAALEGLPFAVEDMPAHYDQGECRFDSGH